MVLQLALITVLGNQQHAVIAVVASTSAPHAHGRVTIQLLQDHSIVLQKGFEWQRKNLKRL